MLKHKYIFMYKTRSHTAPVCAVEKVDFVDILLTGLRAAAEPTRLRILALLSHGELTVSELTRILGQSQPRVSRHLKLLCDAGLATRIPFEAPFREEFLSGYRAIHPKHRPSRP